jgi:ABC-type bacteriocin/lantibiotic exporters, contain an N-terminal double-glycine peptidase domain
MFNAPVASFVGIGAQLQETHGYADRIGDVLRQPVDPMLAVGRETGPLPKFSGRVEVENVSFGYSPITPPQLADVSLSIKPGARIGIVGGSGSGKSTLGGCWWRSPPRRRARSVSTAWRWTRSTTPRCA